MDSCQGIYKLEKNKDDQPLTGLHKLHWIFLGHI